MLSALKLSWRTISRDRLYVAINTGGLALAIACCLLLSVYLYKELSYDRHFDNHERIFRVANAFEDYDTGNQRRELAITSPALAAILQRDYPQIEAVVRLFPVDGELFVQHDEEAFYWDNAYFADDTLFSIFSHRIVHGDPANALVDPLGIAISQSVAETYFGDENPLGELLTLDDGDIRHVALVFEDLPENTHLRYDIVLSLNHPEMAIADADVPRQLFGAATYTYLLMPEGYEAEQFNTIAQDFYGNNMEDLARQRTNRAWSGWLQPLSDIHLGERLLNDLPGGNRYYLYALSSIIVFILMIACSNYTNLAVAGYSRRFKEVTVRRILGASRLALIGQFLFESILLAVVSLCVGVVMVEMAISQGSFSAMLGNVRSLAIPREYIVLAAGGLCLVLGIIAGLYPALYLSSGSMRSSLSMRSRSGGGKGANRIREMLLLLQFTVSIAVLSGTLTVARQMNFITDQPLGFNKEDKVVVTLRGEQLLGSLATIETELRRNPGIQGVTYASSSMGQGAGVNATQLEAENGAMETMQISHMAVAQNFAEVMALELVAGRNFSSAIAGDATGAVLVNETLVRSMGWDNPIGKSVQTTWGSRGTVVGVIGDFNFSSLRVAIEPFLMYQPAFSNENRLGSDRSLVVHLSPGATGETLQFIEDVIVTADPQRPFEYTMLETVLDELYQPEGQLLYLSGVFSAVSLLITCLGLFALTAYAIEQRSQEIGIRKVLGASSIQILGILGTRTMALIIAATVLAALATWPAITFWLSTFEYRVELQPLLFVGAALVVAAISGGTIAVQSMRLATISPVSTLRYE